MSGNRKLAESVAIELIEAVLPGGGMKEIYTQKFADMSDDEFEQFINRLDLEEERLAVIAPNFGKVRLDVARNLALAEKLGHQFFERIWINEGNDIPPYLSNDKYLIVPLPLRRQAQLLTKKISTAEDSNSVDDFSGQPIGKSRGSTISYPETQIMRALGLTANQEELLKYRGGDEKGYAAMNASITETGGVSTKSIEKLGSKVKSTQTLSTLLTCAHIENSL